MRAQLASGNPHKLTELRRALPGWEIDLVDDRAFPPETGSTYAENARGKALHGRRGAPPDTWVIGEDSGIEARALGGRPGIASARWAADGVSQLLHELSGHADRRARYVCAVVALGPAGADIVVEGVLEGTVARERSGSEGFGYDPIFDPAAEQHTVGELGDAWKAANSHRARAAAALAVALVDSSPLNRSSTVTRMEPNEALAELLDLSTQVTEGVLLGESGFVVASSGTPERGEELGRVATELLAAAADIRPTETVTRVEIALGNGGVFVVRGEGRIAVATTVPDATAGLVVYDLRTALRRLAEEPGPAPPGTEAADASAARAPRCRWNRVVARRPTEARAAAEGHCRVRRRLGGDARAGLAHVRPAVRDCGQGGGPVTDELGRLLVEHALLEGDFLLRSGKRSTWYLDKYRFETRPELLRAIGERLAETALVAEPDTARFAGPALGAVALAASASMASELPFIIVRSETKEYGTANRIEGPFEREDVVCLLEDVVTSGGALSDSVSALRDAGLVVRNAVCVVDREEGGTDALARLGVRLRSLYRASDLIAARAAG